MPESVHPPVEGLEEKFREGRARIQRVAAEGNVPDCGSAAKRCQHCGASVRIGTGHAWAIVTVEHATGDRSTCYPVFCDPTCLHEWSVDVAES